MNLKQTLTAYLRRIEQYEPQTLGKKARPVTAEDSQFLRDSLDRQLRFNNSIVTVSIVLLCCLFGLGIFLVLYHRNSVNAVAVISGATFASLLGIVRFLRQLWLDKSAMDILIHVSYTLPPAEAAKVVTSFYFKAAGSKAKGKSQAV